MGAGAISNPSSRKHRKNTSEERSKRKKINTTKPKKRRHDSPSSSSGHSSSDSDDDDSRAPRKSSQRRDPKKIRRLLGQDGESSKRRKKSRGRDKGKREKTRYKRRDHSVSSMSSHSSRSCSTCRDRSSSPEVGVSEKLQRLDRRVPKTKLSTRGRSRGREKEKTSRRSPHKVVKKRNSSRYRSPSCSSCSRCSYSRSSSGSRRRSEERFVGKNHLTHSQSEVKGAEKSKEKLCRYRGSEDENREEIVQDYDDLPSSRSNGSYDGGRKRETGLAPLASYHHVSEKKRRTEDSGVMRRDAHDVLAEDDANREEVSSAIVSQLAKNTNDSGRNNPLPYEFESGKEPLTRLKSEVSIHTRSSEAEELILRQKALENFKKFRHGPPANTKSLGDQIHQKDESILMERYGVASGKAKEAQMHQSAKPAAISAKQKAANSLEDQKHIHNGSCPTELRVKSVANPSAQIPIVSDPMQVRNGNKLDSCLNDNTNSKPVIDSVVPNCIPSNKYQNNPNKLQRLKEYPDKKLVEKMSLDKTIPDKKAAAKPGNIITQKVELNKADVSTSGACSCLNSEIGEHNSNEPKLEGKSGSEFEKKTMSVMRGGEMVQVSYKVYIPNKTPALARRQLQREID